MAVPNEYAAVAEREREWSEARARERSEAREGERPEAREGGGGSGAVGVIGVIVLAACAVWSLISAAGRDARPEGVLLAVFAVAAGYAGGRIAGTLRPVAVACAAALTATGLAVVSPQEVPGAYPAGGVVPGDAGATAALLVLGAGAACCAASAARGRRSRPLLWALALAVTCTALVLGSVAGFAGSAGVLLCSLAAARTRRRAVALIALALAAAAAVALSWGVAKDTLPEGLTASLEGQLTGHRMALWQEAAAVAGAEPVRGVGPGRFGELSVTAQQSAVTDGKPHSAVLQQTAEQGVVGLALLAAVFGWLLYGLWRSPRSTAVAVSAGAALTALAVVACLGNALSFTPVTVGAGLLAGLAAARPAAVGGPVPAGL
ncbi:O-antigen ligase family protein [Streptomyces jumonjinensis]|uniref:O-antigen ligase family protein n=1 Tax=Streptomyces jumonjinensis TaxID=1945 RepID=UPI0037B7A8C9